MPVTLEQIRVAGEAKLQKLLAIADAHQREIIRDAVREYGRVQDVPEGVWDQLKQRIENDDHIAEAMLLLLASTDDWMVDEIDRLGVDTSGSRLNSLTGYSREAARRTIAMASAVDTTRDRLARKIEDAKLTGPGDVGELTNEGIDAAIDDVLTEKRRKVAATDAATGAITKAQRTARDRVVGDDGAELKPVGGGTAKPRPQRVLIDLIWRTHPELAKSGKSCTRCSPLEGTNESVWSKTFPEGPGREAHDGCNCELEPRIIVEHADTGEQN